MTETVLTQDEVDSKCSRLRQFAAIASDFYQALIAERYPADAAGRLVEVWLSYELGWVEDVD